MKKCWYTVALAYSMAVAVTVNVMPGLVRDVMAMQGKAAGEEARGIEADEMGNADVGAAGLDGEMAGTDSSDGRAAGTDSSGGSVDGTDSSGGSMTGTDSSGGSMGATEKMAAGENEVVSAAGGNEGVAAAESAGPGNTGQAILSTASQAREDFSHTLFIGDSRTVGLSEYGNLEGADVFANTGMSVFNVFDAQIAIGDNGKQTLEQVLSQNRYEAVYLMLGINELGYGGQEIVGRYESVVGKIREIQPDAALILEANLHVTQEKSEQSPIYNNDKINALNREIEGIASDKGCLYIDINEIFDDDNGNLDSGYSSDGSHVLGKYYAEWGEWIRKFQHH